MVSGWDSGCASTFGSGNGTDKRLSMPVSGEGTSAPPTSGISIASNSSIVAIILAL